MALDPERILAARQTHHFGNPVAGAEQRIEPFEREYARRGRRPPSLLGDRLDPLAQRGDNRGGLIESAGRLRNLLDGRQDSGQTRGLE